MPAINQIVDTLDSIELPEGFRPEVLFIDGDDTACRFGAVEPYPDYDRFVAQVEPEKIVIVTGNPNPELARMRRIACGADIVVHPRFPTVDKRGLLANAIEQLSDELVPQSALVVGNRWLTDVVIPRAVLFKRDIENYGVRVDRQDARIGVVDRILLRPLDRIGANVLGLVGVDHLIRPRVE